ncbi:MAG: ArsA family ATPase [Leptolyngbyaceae bacterium]|nr:ArsA family ATPase [Leptolyngbyaceae bacterium]
MTLILTFLGKGGVGRSTVAIATAQHLAHQGKRVLLASHDSGPVLGLWLGLDLTCSPQALSPNIDVLQFQSTALFERSWEDVKRTEAQYLKDPFFKNVYGQELGIMPGMDEALALDQLRQYEAAGTYDVIVYDGRGDQSTLRMLGMPEVLGWYLRRFRNVFLDSDLVKTLTPFAQPVASAVLNVDWGGDWLAQPTNNANNVLEQGKAAVNDPHRVVAYLVTTPAPEAIATAKYLWGSAQQIGLSVNGVLCNQAQDAAEISSQCLPLSVTALPECSLKGTGLERWQPLTAALPDMSQTAIAPPAMTIDTVQRTVKLFLPYFDKKQVKLTQYGPEVTIEAGDQRRNISLPPELRGKPVTGAKFQDSYLIISF